MRRPIGHKFVECVVIGVRGGEQIWQPASGEDDSLPGRVEKTWPTRGSMVPGSSRKSVRTTCAPAG